jgi:hypothetical protein
LRRNPERAEHTTSHAPLPTIRVRPPNPNYA